MINLKDTPYRLFFDESWKVEKREFKTKEVEPWYHELHASNAVLSPKSETQFEVYMIGEGSKALNRLCKRRIKLDGENIYIFANNDLPHVLSNVKFYKKRTVTEAMRQRGKELAKKFGFKGASK